MLIESHRIVASSSLTRRAALWLRTLIGTPELSEATILSCKDLVRG